MCMKKIRIDFLLDEDLHKILKDRARARRSTLSYLLRELILQSIQNAPSGDEAYLSSHTAEDSIS